MTERVQLVIFDDVDPYPWSDIAFENTGEALVFQPVSSTGTDTSFSSGGTSGCKSNASPCIGEQFEIIVPQVYSNTASLAGMTACSGSSVADCDKFSTHKFKILIGDEDVVLGNYTSYAKGHITATDFANGSDGEIKVINNKPRIEYGGVGFTNWQSN